MADTPPNTTEPAEQENLLTPAEPALSDTDKSEEVAFRNKRQRTDDVNESPEISSNYPACACQFRTELHEMFESWKAEQNERISMWQAEQESLVRTLVEDVNEIKIQWGDAYEEIQSHLEVLEGIEEHRSFEEPVRDTVQPDAPIEPVKIHGKNQENCTERLDDFELARTKRRGVCRGRPGQLRNKLLVRIRAGHQRMPTMVTPGPSGAQLQRSYIWSGVIEWMEKGKAPGDQQKTTKHLPCQVSASTKDIEPELKVDTWPNKLLMQLMPKQLISNIGGQYLKDSKSVLFHLQPSEALDALTKVMVNGFAGCVHFSPMPTPPQCDIKVLILLYTPDKKAYLGFIPNNQATFVDRLRKVIQQQKISQIISKQQLPAAVSNAGGMQQNMPNATMAGSGAMAGNAGMSPGGMGGGMAGGMQAGPGSVPGGVPSMPGGVPSMPGPAGSQGMVQAQMQQHPQGMMIGGSIGQQVQQVGGKGPRPGVTQLDGLEAARQHNLEKIQHLQQTLEAAHQQEAQFKSQMDIMSHLHAAQQQEQHYKQLEEQQRKHQLQQQLQQQLRGAGGVAHPPRVMRPLLPSNPGLRHLLQQPQYRPGAGAPRAAAPPQQFDDVSNYSDFI